MPRKCTHCRAEIPRKKDCTDPAQAAGFCSLDHMSKHGLEKGRKQMERRRQQVEREARNRDKARKQRDRQRLEELKPRSKHLKEAQQAFNAYIRARDEGLPCICCGRFPDNERAVYGGEWDAGHYLSVGSHPELRFDEANCHRQLKSCNAGAGKYTRKNYTVSQEYRERLIERIGEAEVLRLEGPNEPKHYTIEDLKEIKAHYRRLTRELQKQREAA